MQGHTQRTRNRSATISWVKKKGTELQSTKKKAQQKEKTQKGQAKQNNTQARGAAKKDEDSAGRRRHWCVEGQSLNKVINSSCNYNIIITIR